jgi:hypothetical protein
MWCYGASLLEEAGDNYTISCKMYPPGRVLLCPYLVLAQSISSQNKLLYCNVPPVREGVASETRVEGFDPMPGEYHATSSNCNP